MSPDTQVLPFFGCYDGSYSFPISYPSFTFPGSITLYEIMQGLNELAGKVGEENCQLRKRLYELSLEKQERDDQITKQAREIEELRKKLQEESTSRHDAEEPLSEAAEDMRTLTKSVCEQEDFQQSEDESVTISREQSPRSVVEIIEVERPEMEKNFHDDSGQPPVKQEPWLTRRRNGKISIVEDFEQTPPPVPKGRRRKTKPLEMR